MRWSQLGFGRTSTTSRSQDTPRNLMGLKDGTANIRAEDTEAMRRFVWVGRRRARPGCAAAATWSPAGSGCCSRSGTAPRSKTRSRRSAATSTAAPRSAARRRVRPARPRRRARTASRLIPVDAHVRLASAQANDGERILRRGYSFTDGVDESLGELEAGLFFICFQRDPAQQFVAIQRRLGSIRRAQRVHQARRQRRLRRPARGRARRLRRRNPARLSAPLYIRLHPVGFC